MLEVSEGGWEIRALRLLMLAGWCQEEGAHDPLPGLLFGFSAFPSLLPLLGIGDGQRLCLLKLSPVGRQNNPVRQDNPASSVRGVGLNPGTGDPLLQVPLGCAGAHPVETCP